MDAGFRYGEMNAMHGKRNHRRKSPAPRLILSLLLAVAALLTAAASLPAWAHAIVVRASPQEGEAVTGPLSRVELWYDAPISPSMVALSVTDPAGQRIDRRDAAIDRANGAHVAVSVNAATPGEYTVRYRAISADGHIVSGSYRFKVIGQ